MKLTYVLVVILIVVLALIVASMFLPSSIIGGGIIGGGLFRFKVSDPEYTALLKGTKTIEARLDKAPFNTLTGGSTVIVVRSRPKDDTTSEYPGGEYKFIAKITGITKYPNIKALLDKHLSAAYPNRTQKDAIAQFEKYLPPDASSDGSVIAFSIQKLDAKKLDAKKVPMKVSNRNYNNRRQRNYGGDSGTGGDHDDYDDHDYDRDDHDYDDYVSHDDGHAARGSRHDPENDLTRFYD